MSEMSPTSRLPRWRGRKSISVRWREERLVSSRSLTKATKLSSSDPGGGGRGRWAGPVSGAGGRGRGGTVHRPDSGLNDQNIRQASSEGQTHASASHRH